MTFSQSARLWWRVHNLTPEDIGSIAARAAKRGPPGRVLRVVAESGGAPTRKESGDPAATLLATLHRPRGLLRRPPVLGFEWLALGNQIFTHAYAPRELEGDLRRVLTAACPCRIETQERVFPRLRAGDRIVGAVFRSIRPWTLPVNMEVDGFPKFLRSALTSASGVDWAVIQWLLEAVKTPRGSIAGGTDVEGLLGLPGKPKRSPSTPLENEVERAAAWKRGQRLFRVTHRCLVGGRGVTEVVRKVDELGGLYGGVTYNPLTRNSLRKRTVPSWRVPAFIQAMMARDPRRFSGRMVLSIPELTGLLALEPVE